MKKKQFFLLIFLLVIGFASISATLAINGNTNVAANLEDFDVVFIEGLLNGETSNDVSINEDKKTLTFTTNVLSNINDTARIDYKVKNISTQYDGDVTINCTNDANNYVEVTSSFDGKTLPLENVVNMQAQEIKSGYINVKLTKASLETQEIKIACTIEVIATSRTNYAYSLIFDSNGGTSVEDKMVEYNQNYGNLATPEKEGYEFIGWFNEDDVMVSGDTILDTKGNRNLYAQWSKNTYSVELKKIYSDKTEISEINVPFGESVDTLITVGEENYISKIECTNGYIVENFDESTAVYNRETIRINNNSSPKNSTCSISVTKGVYNYSYTGAEQTFTAGSTGVYKIELNGAQGGSLNDSVEGGKGALQTGTISLQKSKSLSIFIGGQNGYNGGGEGSSQQAVGGGASDIRLDGVALNNRILVAGGGGGSYTTPNYHVHSGSSSSGGGCYTVSHSSYYTYTLQGNGEWDGGAANQYNYFCPRCGKHVTHHSVGTPSLDGQQVTCRNCVIGVTYSLGCNKTEGETIESYSYAEGKSESSSNNTIFQGSIGGGGGYYGGNTQYAGTSYASEYIKNASTTKGSNTGDGYAKITYLGKE